MAGKEQAIKRRQDASKATSITQDHIRDEMARSQSCPSPVRLVKLIGELDTSEAASESQRRERLERIAMEDLPPDFWTSWKGGKFRDVEQRRKEVEGWVKNF